jgi:hypothetical protein
MQMAEFYAVPRTVPTLADAGVALRDKGVDNDKVADYLLGNEKMAYLAGIKQVTSEDTFNSLPTHDLSALMAAAQAAGFDVEITEL